MSLPVASLRVGDRVRARTNAPGHVEQIVVDAAVAQPASVRTINARAGHVVLLDCVMPDGTIELREVAAGNIMPPARRRSAPAPRLGGDDGWGEGASSTWSSTSAAGTDACMLAQHTRTHARTHARMRNHTHTARTRMHPHDRMVV